MKSKRIEKHFPNTTSDKIIEEKTWKLIKPSLKKQNSIEIDHIYEYLIESIW